MNDSLPTYVLALFNSMVPVLIMLNSRVTVYFETN